MGGKGKTGGKRSARAADDLSLDLPVPPGGEPLAMPFCRIPAGEFRMGSRSGISREEPRHPVRLAEDFWLGRDVVTQGEYRQVLQGLGLAGTKRPDGETWNDSPSKHEGSDRLPVERVSWDDARLWCEALSIWLEREGSPWRVRLPTEIEWEYGCRGGTETEYWTGDDEAALVDVAWFANNSGGKPHAVDEPLLPSGDSPKSSAFGLVGMHGNVWEWCADSWTDGYASRADGWVAQPSAAAGDPPRADRFRVFRGGAWDFSAGGCRSAYRNRYWPDARDASQGFRVCLVRGPAAEKKPAGGGAAGGHRGAEGEQAKADKAGGARPPSDGAGEPGAGERIRQEDLSVAAGQGPAAWALLLAAAGRRPAAAVPTLQDPARVRVLALGKLDDGFGDDVEQSCGHARLDFSRFTSLTHLILWNLSDLEAIDGLPPSLVSLDLRRCRKLETLPQAKLPRLETLDLEGCQALESIPAWQPPGLRWVHFDGCTKIGKAGTDALGQLLAQAKQLEELTLVDCAWLEHLTLPAQAISPPRGWKPVGDPRFPPGRLKKLVLEGCTGLSTLPDLDGYPWLHHLDLRRCAKIEAMPKLPVGEEEGRPTGIRTLDAIGCGRMKTFRGLDIRRVHRGDGAPSAGEHAASATAAVNVAGQFRTLTTLANDPAELRMAKVLFLGSGRCGKTTVSKALRWQQMDPQGRRDNKNGPLDPCPTDGQQSTVNIRLDEWRMPQKGAAAAPTTIHAWDFGGQEIYHNTHRLFASEGAVFVIVTTHEDEHARRVAAEIEAGVPASMAMSEERFLRENAYRELEYWLDYVWEARGLRSPCGEGAPDALPKVLVVYTGARKNGAGDEVDIETYLEQQAGRYKQLFGASIQLKVVDVWQTDFDALIGPMHKIVEWLWVATSGVVDELGIRVPRLYADVAHRCSEILTSNARIRAARPAKGERSAGLQERFEIPAWQKLVAGFDPASASRSPRQVEEIARGVADYLHACGRVYRLDRPAAVIVDQQWGVELVYKVVPQALANDARRLAIHRLTREVFDRARLREELRNEPEVEAHWEFLMGLFDACDIVVGMEGDRGLAVHPELLGLLDRRLARKLWEAWVRAENPPPNLAPLVNHSFAIHASGRGLLLGRSAFQKIAATIARTMRRELPRFLFLGADDERSRAGDSWERFSDDFECEPHFWRDGFQIYWCSKSLHPRADGPERHTAPPRPPEVLMLRMEWVPSTGAAGRDQFAGGIFVQLLCSDEATKSARLEEILFGSRSGAGDPAGRSPAGFPAPLADYRHGEQGAGADLELHDERPPNLGPELARGLRGIGAPGWIHSQGPLNDLRFDVAISYRRKASAEFVAALHGALAAAGLLVYYDQERLMDNPGPSIVGRRDDNTLLRIYDTLRRARVLVIVPSLDYFSEPESEVNIADNTFCPVELAEAILAGQVDAPRRPAKNLFWVYDGTKPQGHVVVDKLGKAVNDILSQVYQTLVHPRLLEPEGQTVVHARENVSVCLAVSRLANQGQQWIEGNGHGTDQSLVPGTSAAGGWDFAPLVARIHSQLETSAAIGG